MVNLYRRGSQILRFSGSSLMQNGSILGGLAVSTSSLNNATQGTYFSQTLTATGGTPPYTWAAYTDSSALAIDPDLMIDTKTGEFCGIPRSTGNYSATIKVTDAVGNSATRVLAHTVNSSGALTILTQKLFKSIAGYQWNQQIIVTGGTWPYTYAVVSGTLPTWTDGSGTHALGLGAYNGVLSTPAYYGNGIAVGTYNFTVRVTDAIGATQDVALSFVQLGAGTPLIPGIGPGAHSIIYQKTIPAGIDGKTYSYPIKASGGTGPYTFAVTRGALPTGLTLNSTTGSISGTISSGKTIARFWVTITDSLGETISTQITLEVFRVSETWGGAVVAKKPYLTMDPWRNYSSPGNVVVVSNGAQLTAALTTAAASLTGTTIRCNLGNYDGAFTLPVRPANALGWVYIESAALASLPASGTRVSRSSTANMPRFRVNATNGNCFTGQNYSGGNVVHHYRLVGLFLDPNGFSTYGFFESESVGLYSQMSHHIVFDRCYWKGNDTVGYGTSVFHSLNLNSAFVAVVDCYGDDVSSSVNTSDSQALNFIVTPGPTLVVNNYLEASTENFISGGSDVPLDGLGQNNTTFTDNQLWKPWSWWNSQRLIKNIFELKTNRYGYMARNVLSNSWAAAQDGRAILFTIRTQNNSNPWGRITDITWENNRLLGAIMGVNLTYEDDEGGSSDTTARITFRNSVFQVGGIVAPNQSGTHPVYIAGPTPDILFDHCLLLTEPLQFATSYGSVYYFESSGSGLSMPIEKKRKRFVSTNCIFDISDFGICVDGGGWGFNATNALNAACDTYLVSNNVAIGGGSHSMPANNFTPANRSLVGFGNYVGGVRPFNSGNYTLTTGAYKGAGRSWDGQWADSAGAPDGSDIGPNFTTLGVNPYETPLFRSKTFPAGTRGVVYSTATERTNYPIGFDTDNGTAPMQWSLLSGALPAGLVIEPASGYFGVMVNVTLVTGSSLATVPSVPAGLAIGSTISNSEYIVPAYTSVVGISGTTLTLSNPSSYTGTVWLLFHPVISAGASPGIYNFVLRATDYFSKVADSPTLSITVS